MVRTLNRKIGNKVQFSILVDIGSCSRTSSILTFAFLGHQFVHVIPVCTPRTRCSFEIRPT